MTLRTPSALTLPSALLCSLVAVGCGSGNDDDGPAPATTVVNAPADDMAATGGTTSLGDMTATGGTGGMIPTGVTTGNGDAIATGETDGNGDAIATGETDGNGDAIATGETDGNGDATATGETDGNGDATATGGMGTTTAFDGVWLQACTVNDPTDLSDGYSVTTLTNNGTSSSVRSLEYTDSACSVPNMPAEIVIDAVIVFTGDTTDTALGQATNIDVSFDSATVDGVSQSVPPQTIHDIAFTTGNELYFGDDEIDPARDGSSPGARPVVLESPPFLRQ